MENTNIYKKLLQFSKLGITIEKDSKNPHFHNRYSSLNEVLGKLKKPLNDLGVVIVQSPQEEGLQTLLIDVESGDIITSLVPYVNPTDMQKLGGAISYAKRYALISMLGLEDEDDDAEIAVSGAKQTREDVTKKAPF